MSHLRTDAGPPLPRRPSWPRYLLSIGLVLLIGAAVAVPVIGTSDWWQAHHSSVPAHHEQPLRITANPVTARWNEPGPAPTGNPVVSDTVVTADTDGVTGRDPGNGSARWQYRRSGTHLCGWTVQGTSVITAFADGDDCSDLAAFDAATGRRLWYLNADLPRDIKLIPGPVAFLASTPDRITGFYLNGGNQAWTFHKKGCTFSDAASGDLGVFVIAHCASRPAAVIRLDAYNGKQKWQRDVAGDNPAVLSATGVAAMTSYQRDRWVISLFADDGSATGRLYPNGLSAAAPVSWAAEEIGSQVVTYVGGRVLAFDPVRARISWSVPARGPALVAKNLLLVPEATGFTEYQPGGRRGVTIKAPVPADTSAVGRVRNEVVAVTAERTTVYG